MKVLVFAVYDSKAQAFMQPFFSNAVGSAIRAFGDAVNDAGTPLAKHPGDYQLYEVGEWNDREGLLLAANPHILHGNGADFVAPKRDVFGKPLDRKMEKIVKEAVVEAGVEANHGS